MARAPGLGPGYREFESHHSDIFFLPCKDLEKIFQKIKNFFQKLEAKMIFFRLTQLEVLI